jgi:polyisoprenoid-binding protein YceI
MIKWILIAALAALLAACGAAATSAPTASESATPASAVVASAPSSTDAPVPATAAPTATAATQDTTVQADDDVRTFAIVPDQTEASYTVQEQFLNRDLPTTAVGTTNAVEGQFQFTADDQPSGQVTKITVDLRTLTSDSTMRDNRIRSQWLESDTYPFAEFVSTGAQNLPASYTAGQEVSFTLLGNLTIHGITRPATFDVTGTLEGNTVKGTATTTLKMTDFGFEPPSVAGILTVEDNVTVALNFSAVEAA